MVYGIIAAVILVFVVLFFASGYRKAPPDTAFIISGRKKRKDQKYKTLIGEAGIKLPFFQRLDKLDLSLIPIDVRTSSDVPTLEFINVRVNSTVNIRIGKSPEMIELAATHFLNKTGHEIGTIARETLEASVREIIGTMYLKDMVSNREAFTSKVLKTAVPDLAKMGLEIVSFNVQDFVDANEVIVNLGVDNVEQIRKGAQISRAEAEKEIAIAKAKAAKEANDAKAEAQEAIAERNAQLDTKQAELRKAVDTQQAQAEAAKLIESENQRKLRDIAATDADIAKAERQAELKRKEVELKEYELTAVVRKKAEADKYAAEQEAEAQQSVHNRAAEAKAYSQMKAAEALAYETEQKANAAKVQADADRYVAEQKAAGIAAVGAAEAEAILKKAEAQKAMGEASVLEMYLAALPQIVANASAPLTNVKEITMYGEGNSAKMVGDVMNTANQILAGVEQATGINLANMLSSYMGAKAANN